MKTLPQQLSDFFEPVFCRFDDGYWLNECPDAGKLEHYLISKIRRNHKDLDSHVRRILLNIKFKRESQLIGALQDLCFALGNKGKPIKNNLLECSKELLPSEKLECFRVAIDEYEKFSPFETPHSYLHKESVSHSLQQNKNIIVHR